MIEGRSIRADPPELKSLIGQGNNVRAFDDDLLNMLTGAYRAAASCSAKSLILLT